MRYLVLLIGVFCCSTSVIFIKISSTDPIVLSAYRLILGGAILLPLFLLERRKSHHPALGDLIRRAFPPAIFLSIHFITWIIGARLTPSANASLIVNMVPVVMPLLLLAILNERITRREAWGTSVAILGVVVLGLGDFTLSPEYALGDAMCFLSMLFYAFYLLYARKNRDLPSIYLYVIPVYLLSGLLCLLIASILTLARQPVVWIGANLGMEWIAILGLAIVPTVFGHSIINWAFRCLRAQAVVILNLTQFIFAGVMGYLLLSETPHAVFYLASIMVVSGAVVVIQKSRTPL